MSTPELTEQRVGEPSPPSVSPPAGSLPDLNAETYPVEEVQKLLDQAAYFSLLAQPDHEYAKRTPLIPDQSSGPRREQGREGLIIAADLHGLATGFTATAEAPADTVVGEPVARYLSRFLFAPPDFGWRPGLHPPATRFDPTREQNFVLYGDRVSFGEGERHGFFGYGVGKIFPTTVQGEARLLIGAVGNVTQGFGKFRGLLGVYALNGVLTDECGFAGSLICRMVDPQGRFHSDEPLAELVPELTSPGKRGRAEADATYIVMSGRKPSPPPPTRYGPPPGGGPGRVTLLTTAKMNSTRPLLALSGAGGLRTALDEGETVGELDARITLDLAAAPGTAQRPNPFTTSNLYRFTTAEGRRLGTVTAEILLGRSFDLAFASAPGQKALRFGGFGRVTEGTGIFEGAEGLVSINSAVGLAPHALSMLHVMRLAHPPRLAAAPGEAGAERRRSALPPRAARNNSGGRTMVGTVHEHDLVLRTGERMHYREAGSPDGRPILLLHGNPGYSLAWNPVMERLADLGRLIAPDLIGFGDSQKTDTPPSFYHHAEFVDQFVEGLGLRDVTLFIQDWGGAIGFDHAVRHQENIRAIAFFEAILKPYESWESFPQQIDPAKIAQGDPQQGKSALARQKFQEFRQDPRIGGKGWEQITAGNIFVKIFMGPLLGHPFDPRQIPEPEKDPVLGPLLAPYFRPFPTIWSRNSIWRLAREIPIAGEPADVTASVRHYSEVLAGWEVPKLLIYSNSGPTLKEEHAEWVRRNWSRNLTVRNLDQIPGVEVVEGTHFLQQTHPDQISDLFREWYSRLS